MTPPRSVSAQVAAALERALDPPERADSPVRSPAPSGRASPAPRTKNMSTPHALRKRGPLVAIDALHHATRVSGLATPGSPATPCTPASRASATAGVALPGVGAAGMADDANKRFRASNEDIAVVIPWLQSRPPLNSVLYPPASGLEPGTNPGALPLDDNASLSSLYSVEDLAVGPPPQRCAAFVAVYDGHNGDAAAKAAGSRLHKKFADHLAQQESHGGSPSVRGAFEHAYADLDSELRKERLFTTGCTAVTCYIHTTEDAEDGDPAGGSPAPPRRILSTANVGDARAVLCRGGHAMRLSTDHRAGDELERARIERAGGFVCARRVNGVLEVSRALGDHSFKSVVVPTPDVSEVVLGEADEFVVVACDGLWDWVSDQRAVELASDAFDDGCSASDVSALLVRAALAAGSTDNVTVVCVALTDAC